MAKPDDDEELEGDVGKVTKPLPLPRGSDADRAEALVAADRLAAQIRAVHRPERGRPLMYERRLDLLTLARETWIRALALPYIWGGDDGVGGFDCSGLVIEGLKSCGLFPREGDDTADGLMRRYPRVGEAGKALPEQIVAPGSLLFWGPSMSQATHVEIVWAVLEGQLFTLGASGGGSKTKTREDAIAQNAYVKIRPARGGWIAAVDPFARLKPAA